METSKPMAWHLIQEGKVATTSHDTPLSLGISLPALPTDEVVYVLMANEGTVGARISTSPTLNTPQLANGQERGLFLMATDAASLQVKPVSGTGVILGWQVWKAAR